MNITLMEPDKATSTVFTSKHKIYVFMFLANSKATTDLHNAVSYCNGLKYKHNRLCHIYLINQSTTNIGKIKSLFWGRVRRD